MPGHPDGEPRCSLFRLVLVITAATLLLAIAAPHVQGALIAQRQARIQRDLVEIQAALQRYYLLQGHYPDRLADLIATGNLPLEISLQSPLSGFWYFYAVDDNRGGKAQAYVLGAPTPEAGPPGHLYRGLPLPKGSPPVQIAPAWFNYQPSHPLYLYTEEDRRPLVTPPARLDGYRHRCRESSATPCDLLMP